MSSISSPITLTKWVYSIVMTLAVAVACFATGIYAGAACWFVLTLIVINVLVLSDSEDTQHKVAEILLFISSLAIAAISFAWWSAFFYSVPALLLTRPSGKIRNLLVLILTASTFGLTRLHGEDRKTVMLQALILIVFYALWILFSVFADKYEARMIELDRALKMSTLDSLTEKNLREELARQKTLSEANARLKERERISRDIHNSVGHTLSAASVTLDAAQLLVDKDSELAARKMEQANVRVHEAIDSIRGAVRTLDSKDDTLLVSDYIASLSESLNNYMMDTDIRIHDNLKQIEDKGRIDIDTSAFLSGALNELLTNGVKHGKANVFVVVLNLTGSNISLKVQDNGSGWGQITYEEKQLKLSEGFGLRKLRDHVRSLGGDMKIEGSDGFVVEMSLPRLMKEENDG